MAIVWDDQSNNSSAPSTVQWDDHQEAPLFGGPIAKTIARGGGAIAGELLAGLTAPETGGASLLATAPAAAGGAALADYLRGRLQSAMSGDQPAPVMDSIKAGLPYAAFPVGSAIAGRAMEGAGELAGNIVPEAKQLIQNIPFGKVLSAASRAGAGSSTAATVGGLSEGQSLPQSLQQGVQAFLPGFAIGGAVQGVTNAAHDMWPYLSGNQPGVLTATHKYVDAAESKVQGLRSPAMVAAMHDTQQGIWDKIEQPIIADNTPLDASSFYKAALQENNPNAVVSVMKAFGVSPKTVAQYGNMPEGAMLESLEPQQVTPQEALDAATSLRPSGSSKQFYSAQDSADADARSAIYGVLKDRLSPESQQQVSNGLQEYKNFATLRDQLMPTIDPFGGPNAPTSKGIDFISRLASQKVTSQTPQDTRLSDFITQLSGKPILDQSEGNLVDLYSKMQKQQAIGSVGDMIHRLLSRWAVYRILGGAASTGKDVLK